MMSLKTFFSTQQKIIILTLTLCAINAYGQSNSVINRYFLIELGKETPQTSFTTNTEEHLTWSKERLCFAIKTNLLFDAASIINAEVEFPIADRWSLAGEIIFPWWTMDNHKYNSRRNRLQIVNGTIETKYWWNHATYSTPLCGWFTGIYTSLGTYDIEHNARGYQGDTIFSVGVSGGYAHQINRSGDLHMEYTLGVGYMTTYYHHYHAEFCDNNRWHAVEMRNGRYKWFGPTRAKVSLVWLINCNN